MEYASVVRVNIMTLIKHVSGMRCWSFYCCKRQICARNHEIAVLLPRTPKLLTEGCVHRVFAFEIQGLGPKGFCSSIMETTLYETIRSGVLTRVVHDEVQNSRFGNVLRDVIVIRLFNFLTLNY